MRAWLARMSTSQVFRSALIAGALMAGLLLALAALGRGDSPVVSAPVTQVDAIMSSASAFVDVTDPPAGQTPVTVLPSTDYVDLVSTTSAAVTYAQINAGTGVTAAVFTEVKGAPHIYASRLLPEQYDALLAAYDRADASVSVVGTTGSRVVAGPRGATRVVPASEAVSSGPPWVLIAMVLGGIGLVLYALARRARMKAAAAAVSVASNDVDTPPDTRFADVAGCEEAVEDLQELVMFLQDRERFTRTGAAAPQGALLIGPPGTGKTLLARAVAGEASVPFYAVSGSDFVEMYVGVGARRVRETFAKARKHPEGAILFIDEIDAIGKKRSSGSNGSNQEHDQTLNALLVEMDGFRASSVIVLAATNRDDILDPALVRPGRLDRKVHVGLPDRAGREKILAVHAAGKPLAGDVNLSLVARRTPGMSGAELAQVVNEACLHAVRADRDTVTAMDFDGALATVAMGKARTSALISEEDRTLTAWHEAGHAVCGLVQEHAVDPLSITLIPRGRSGGSTWFPENDSGYLSRRMAYARLVTGMGGMAAEQMLLGDGEFTSGPSGDLQASTQVALTMITRFGMGERLIVKSDELLHAAADATDEALVEADMLLRRALEDAKALLAGNRDLFDAMVTSLLEHETLGHAQIQDLVAHRSVVPAAPAPPAPRREPVTVPRPVPVPARPVAPRGLVAAVTAVAVGQDWSRWGRGTRRKRRAAG
jgi:cell division protease FtsH